VALPIQFSAVEEPLSPSRRHSGVIPLKSPTPPAARSGRTSRSVETHHRRQKPSVCFCCSSPSQIDRSVLKAGVHGPRTRRASTHRNARNSIETMPFKAASCRRHAVPPIAYHPADTDFGSASSHDLEGENASRLNSPRHGATTLSANSRTRLRAAPARCRFILYGRLSCKITFDVRRGARKSVFPRWMFACGPSSSFRLLAAAPGLGASSERPKRDPEPMLATTRGKR